MTWTLDMRVVGLWQKELVYKRLLHSQIETFFAVQ